MTDAEARQVIEALLFVSDEPVTTSELAQLLELPAAEIERLTAELSKDYQQRGAGLVLREVAGGWRLATHPSAAPFLDRFVDENRRARLTQAALETMAIIAYRQPISRAQLAEIRGVSADSVVRTLIARGLVEEVGRDPGPGLAVLYGTTAEFLERLGLKSLAELPALPQFMPDPKAVERMESGLGPGV
jgi:segregation and condensation protein B